ncbi:hypothetical protein [Lacibacter sp.]|uniref:hypothetical protein n=1 Tax=Lacibacter sp. TaxID=1915409 RepID=UPI002B4AB5F8|nr:hypothetical protein [Lacibacter sp.]HLP38079.1 hypothetical protein [Lacibacter sp.]
MTTNFTLRDFFVYLLSGLTLLICLGTIFHAELFRLTVIFFDKYDFVKEFSFLVTILLIPAIYLLGHIIGSLSYGSLQFFVWTDKKFKKSGKQIPKWKYFILIKLQQLFYRQRVVYAVIKWTKSDSSEKPFKSVAEFWTSCAKLQIEKIYTPAEYWYVLNELFNSINLIFFISTIISFLNKQWILGILYLVMTIFAFKRAKQYAAHFIQAVVNLTVARQNTQPGK